MKHYVKTKYGISDDFIQASDTLHFGGSGQGNRGGTICWYSHMKPLLIVYAKKRSQGLNFEDSTKVHQFLQWIVGYVDNNYILLTFGQDQTTKHVLKEAQDALISLKKLFQITGGDLALEKYVISFTGWSLKSREETLDSIQKIS